MRKILIVVSVFIAVQGFSALATAGVLLGDLCGTTVTTNTEVRRTTESFTGPCVITVATGWHLEIKDSTIEVTDGGSGGDLTINGQGSASIEIFRNDSREQASNSDHIDVEGNFDINFVSGNVELFANDINVDGNFNILTTTGGIEFRSNESGVKGSNDIGIVTGGHFCVDSWSGGIELRRNDIDAGSDFCITTTSGPIELRGRSNIFPGLTTAGNLTIETDAGKIEVRDINTYSTGDTTIRSDDENVEVKGNAVATTMAGNLLIESDTNKVEVKDNDFTGVSGDITIKGSPCQTKSNTPAQTCS